MASKKTVINDEEMNPDVNPDPDLVSNAPDDWEFTTVVEESPTHVVFDTVGDVFIGRFVDRVTITPDNTCPADCTLKHNHITPFDLFRFRARDEELYAVNTSAKLDRGMTDGKVKAGDWVRITLVKFIPSNKGNDFKDFRVEVRTNS